MKPRTTLALALAVAAVVSAARTGAAVRVVRSLDRRGGLTSLRGERAYAASTPLFAALHRRAAADVRAAIAAGARTVVDVGAGPGDLMGELSGIEAVHLIGVEPSAEMRAIAAERGVVEVDGRAEALPLDASSADLIVSTLSMHHWTDPAAALREADRVLAAGGEARIYDVRFAAYSAQELARMAAAAGIEPFRVRRAVLPERLGPFRPYVLITIAARA